MPADIEWDHEVDVLCVGAEGSVLAAGAVAANAGLDVYVGISAGRAADRELAASLGYQGSDKRPRTISLDYFEVHGSITSDRAGLCAPCKR
jgi:hypothetical protein